MANEPNKERSLIESGWSTYKSFVLRKLGLRDQDSIGPSELAENLTDANRRLVIGLNGIYRSNIDSARDRAGVEAVTTMDRGNGLIRQGRTFEGVGALIDAGIQANAHSIDAIAATVKPFLATAGDAFAAPLELGTGAVHGLSRLQSPKDARPCSK